MTDEPTTTDEPDEPTTKPDEPDEPTTKPGEPGEPGEPTPLPEGTPPSDEPSDVPNVTHHTVLVEEGTETITPREDTETGTVNGTP